MRTQNIKVTIDMPIPINRPDLNGYVYTEEAVLAATKNISGKPLRYNDEIIGTIEAAYISSVADDHMNLRVFGIIPFGGTWCHHVQLAEDGETITSYEIQGVGFSE